MAKATVASVERRVGAHDEDIRFIYLELRDHSRILRDHRRILCDHRRILRDHSRELRWLRTAVTSLLTHFGVEPPAEEAQEEE
jgi:hypothetical protein